MSDTATDATAINQVSKANGNNAGSNNPYFKETVTPINQKVAGGGYKTSDDRYVGGMYGTPTVTQAPILNSNVTSGTPEQRSAQMEAGEKLYNTGNYSPDEINYLIKVNAEGGTLPSNLGLQEFHNAQVQYLKTNPTLEYKQQIPQTTKSIMFTDYGRGGTQIQKGEATILNALGYGKYASYNPSYKPSTDIVSKGRTYLEEHIPLFPKSPADVLLTATLPFGIAQSSFTSVKLFASGSAMFLGIKEAYDPEATLKQRIEGGIISTLGAIGFAGEAIPKTRGFIQTFGRTEKLPEELVTKEVLGGKSTFPDLPRNQQLKAFEVGTYSLEPNIKGGYHSTASGYFLESEFKSNTGSSELSGMYIAPSVSQHFLGISPVSENPSLFSSKLGDILGNPKIAFIEPRSFKINPYDLSPEQQFVGQRSVNGKYAFFSEPTEKGIAYLPLMKTEAESVIIEGTSFKRTGQDYYVKLRGQRIAIEQYKALGENDLKLGSTKSKSIFSTNEIKSFPLVTKLGKFILTLTESVLL